MRFYKSLIGDIHYLSAISLQAVYVSAKNCGIPDNIHLKVTITKIDLTMINKGMEKQIDLIQTDSSADFNREKLKEISIFFQAVSE